MAGDQAALDEQRGVVEGNAVYLNRFNGKVLVQAGVDLGDVNIKKLLKNGITEVKVRSVLTCDAATGTCAPCNWRSSWRRSAHG